MKAVLVTEGKGLDRLQMSERDQPMPAEGEVLVNWQATSLNYHDYLVAIGAIPVPEGRIPMSDGAGEVVAVGENVSSWQVGDKVMSLFFPQWLRGKADAQACRILTGETVDGCATQFACVRADSLTPMPKEYSFAEAATLPCAGLTAWYALFEKCEINPGDTVLVEGSGGMSIFALQFAKAAGASVFATTSSEEKMERLKELGAEVVVNYRADEKWGRTIYKLSGGIDHVLDVGGGSTIAQSIEAVAYEGNISSIGILGNPKGEILFPKLFSKHARISGISVGSKQSQLNMIKAIDASGLRPQIDRSFSLTELAEAFRYQEQGAHLGKIVVEY